jgi:hypothetical protein
MYHDTSLDVKQFVIQHAQYKYYQPEHKLLKALVTGTVILGF